MRFYRGTYFILAVSLNENGRLYTIKPFSSCINIFFANNYLPNFEKKAKILLNNLTIALNILCTT